MRVRRIGAVCVAAVLLATSGCSSDQPAADEVRKGGGGGDRKTFCAEAEKTFFAGFDKLTDDESATQEQDDAEFKKTSLHLIELAPDEIRPLMEPWFKREIEAREKGTRRELAQDTEHAADGAKYLEQLAKTCPDFGKSRTPAGG